MIVVEEKASSTTSSVHSTTMARPKRTHVAVKSYPFLCGGSGRSAATGGDRVQL